MSDRLERSEDVYARLFGPRDTSAPDTDPEFGRILRTLIFGDVFATGDLDDRTRELITVTVLASVQALPQLKAHLGAALHVGATPVEAREALYQLAPFLGFPRTLNAIGVLNEVLTARGVQLPLPDQGTTTDADRYDRGKAIQAPLYGDEIADAVAGLPDGLGEASARLLTEHAFGDFYSRGGLDLATRELLITCALTALGLVPQLEPHLRGCVKAGNTPATVVAALIHVAPYAGFPNALNALRVAATAFGAA